MCVCVCVCVCVCAVQKQLDVAASALQTERRQKLKRKQPSPPPGCTLLDVTGGAELSQDINATGGGEQPQGGQAVAAGSDATPQHYDNSRLEKLQNEILELGKLLKVVAEEQQAKRPKTQIGRASCRERV